MSSMLKFKFDPNQDHQLFALNSTMALFKGMKKYDDSFQIAGEDTIPNLPEYENLNDSWLLDNLQNIQRQNNLPESYHLDVDDGLILDKVAIDSWRYPSFTCEMETGTGKTYVYLRTIHQLK